MIEQGIDYQLVPPHVHQHNSMEHAICTFKNHFIAGLCSVDQDFPIHLWDCLLPQALLTLNLLCGSQINLKLSAYTQIHGTFNHNRTPLAPTRICIMVHQKLSNRLSWGMHAIDGWYIGPALESYHCYCVWIWETCMECICDTLVWYPTKVNLPTVSNTNLILAALQDILQILWNPLPDQSLPPLDPTHVQALINTSNLLTQVISPNSSKSLRVGTEAKKSNGVPTPTPAQPKPVADILEPTS